MDVPKIIAFNLGFHSNIVSALEDLKTDEAFVDVSLSCDGHTIQVSLLRKSSVILIIKSFRVTR